VIIRHITYKWLTWSFPRVPDGDLPPEAHARIDADRHRASALRVVARTITIPWVEDRSLSAHFIGHSHRLRDEWRRWAELTRPPAGRTSVDTQNRPLMDT
jgi:hypothetical protein